MKEEELRRRILELTKKYTWEKSDLAQQVLDLTKNTGEEAWEGPSFKEISEELDLGKKELRILLLGLKARGSIEEFHKDDRVEYVKSIGPYGPNPPGRTS